MVPCVRPRFASKLLGAILALSDMTASAGAETGQQPRNGAESNLPSGRAFLDPRVPSIFHANPVDDRRGGDGDVQPDGAASGLPSGMAFVDPRLPGVFLADPGADTRQASAKDYWSAVTASIRARIAYPEDLRTAAEAGAAAPGGKAVLSFNIDKDGALRDAKLQRSSGDKRLDEAAMAGLRGTSPFPAPPEEVAGKDAQLPVSFVAPPPKPAAPTKQAN